MALPNDSQGRASQVYGFRVLVSENGEGSDLRPGARGLSSFVFLDTTGLLFRVIQINKLVIPTIRKSCHSCTANDRVPHDR